MSDERLDKVEQLLRREQGVALSPEFKRNVLAAVAALPAPELIAPRRTWRDWVYALKLLSSGEKVALGLILAGIAALIIPGTAELLAIFEWELSDLTLSVSFGEMFMTGVGAYAARNNLIGA
jgi:hypothetical protein